MRTREDLAMKKSNSGHLRGVSRDDRPSKPGDSGTLKLWHTEAVAHCEMRAGGTDRVAGGMYRAMPTVTGGKR